MKQKESEIDTKNITVSIYDLDGKRIKTFSSMVEASVDNQFSYNRLKYYIENDSKIILRGFPFIFAKGNAERIDISNFKTLNFKYSKGNSVYKFDKKGNLIDEYNSVDEAAVKNNLTYWQVYHPVKNNKRSYIKDHPYIYSSSPQIDPLDYYPQGENNGKKITIISEDGKEKHTFKNIHAAAAFLNIPITQLKKHITQGSPAPKIIENYDIFALTPGNKATPRGKRNKK